MKIHFIYVTFNKLKNANALGAKLVKLRLAACTNVIPNIHSTYAWKGKIVVDKECAMIVKTTSAKVKQAIQFIKSNHPYEQPAISAFAASHVIKDFAKWVIGQTK
jgi:periplasmic divalent cation tolerance protein